jgi:3'-phosphoadenosine 5'-phosphosulfate sulfotransferase (PAPS reductase)/FAD synthetase
LNSQAGRWEHTITAKFVADFSRDIAPVIEVIPLVKDIWETDDWAETRGFDGEQELTMELLITIKKRPPSHKAKFCTEILKLRPQRRWIRENFGPGGRYEGEEYCRYAGVRRDESKTRANTPIEAWDGFFDCELRCPIADWTKAMCFDYVQAHGEPINELYKLGSGRVGCMPCVDNRKEEILNISARFPDEIDKVRGVEQRTGKTFFMPMYRNVTNSIDDVVRWAKTSRGGRQELFPIMHERDGCESKYGLCE